MRRRNGVTEEGRSHNQGIRASLSGEGKEASSQSLREGPAQLTSCSYTAGRREKPSHTRTQAGTNAPAFPSRQVPSASRTHFPREGTGGCLFQGQSWGRSWTGGRSPAPPSWPSLSALLPSGGSGFRPSHPPAHTLEHRTLPCGALCPPGSWCGWACPIVQVSSWDVTSPKSPAWAPLFPVTFCHIT